MNFPLETITNSLGMKLALIPAGEFLMGSPDSDEIALDREKPQHQVKITRPFYLGVYLVTHADYEKVMGDNPSRFKGHRRRPVEQVSWFDAVAFCNQLSDLERYPRYYENSGDEVSIVDGNGYRLPTEAEWEYACRAGTTSKWSFGDEESQLPEYAWYDANSDNTTHPVGEKEANPWGLHDMHGNVAEWCWDRHDEDYYRDSPVSDPMGPGAGNRRGLRGGAFVNVNARYLRSADRFRTFPTDQINCVGFRLARTCE
jgi:formylglycine-generating enzyme required for sulfatase activity